MSLILLLGHDNKDLAQRFGISETHVSRTVSTWVNFLEIELKLLFQFVDDDENTSHVFREFPDLKFVIDCTE